MNTELLSVVDENDCIIDTCPRHIIHATGLRHRAVHILVFNELGQLFLQKRSMKKDLNGGLWDTSAAGHVDADEDYDISAIREVEEELGICFIQYFKSDAWPDLNKTPVWKMLIIKPIEDSIRRYYRAYMIAGGLKIILMS